MERSRVRVVVSGRVQGVWFRQSTAEEAAHLGVSGWVRNLPSGQVEAVFEGDPRQVEHAVAWTGHGPDRALVTEVERYDETPEGLSEFRIRH